MDWTLDMTEIFSLLGGLGLGSALGALLKSVLDRRTRWDPMAKTLQERKLDAYEKILPPLDFAYVFLLGEIALARRVSGGDSHTFRPFYELRVAEVPYQHFLSSNVRAALSKLHQLRYEIEAVDKPLPDRVGDEMSARATAAINDVLSAMREDVGADLFAGHIQQITAPPAIELTRIIQFLQQPPEGTQLNLPPSGERPAPR